MKLIFIIALLIVTHTAFAQTQKNDTTSGIIVYIKKHRIKAQEGIEVKSYSGHMSAPISIVIENRNLVQVSEPDIINYYVKSRFVSTKWILKFIPFADH